MTYKNILITGSNSGIGKALALYYAKEKSHLFLTGREKTRLDDIKKQCENLGSTVTTKTIDVTDRPQMETWIKACDDEYAIDLVIANAGVSVGQKSRTRDLTDEMFQTNVMGVLNTIEPLIDGFKKRKRGHIVVISSLAAYRVFPGRGVYAATKIAVRYLADSWRMALKSDGVHVTSIHPGFVNPPLTDQNNHAMPGIVSAEKSARIISNGIHKKKAVVAFPLSNFIIARTLQMLPTGFTDWLILKVMG